MALGARERGYEYLAITDHSATHGFGNDVTPGRAASARSSGSREVNERVDGIRVLVGTETNILPDGSPDYDDDLLAELDWVIASVHTSFGMSREGDDQADGRGDRASARRRDRPPDRPQDRAPPPYAVDVEALIEAAARTGTMLEINSAPDRRDLNDVHARAAAQAGVRILVDSDAHGVETLGHRRAGAIATARRAWLTARDVANTLRLGRVLAACASGRSPCTLGGSAASSRGSSSSATSASTAARRNGAIASAARAE